MKFMMVLVLLLSQAAFSFAQAESYSNYSLSGTEYFKLFNYADTENHPRILAFERELIAHADQIVAYLKQHPNYAETRTRHETPQQKLGMILVYTGMFMLNVNNAVLEGKMKTPSINEVGDRYIQVQAYMDLALKLAPEDDRIHSWAIANELRRQKAVTGTVKEETLDRVVELANKNPIFHLFNALTMTSDYNFGKKREAEILKLTELMDSKDSPCWPPIFRTGEAKQCKTTKKTPYAFQGVSTYMGDEFLKTAADLSSTDPAKAKTYAERALSNYKRLNFFLFKKKTNSWAQKEKLDERIALTEKFIATGEFKASYFQSRQFLDIYTCTSCHQDGAAKKSLFVNLR